MTERALITGAAGFVGRHLTAYLAGQGLEIYGMDRPNVHPPKDYSWQWYVGDVTDAGQVHSVVRDARPDYVFHLAALINSNSLADLLAVNVIGTQNVLDALAAVRPEARVLVAGSSAEYGLAWPGELPIREGSPLRPLSPYGVSKVAQSLLTVQHAYRNGLIVVRTRTFNLTGPGEPDTLVCSAFARQVAEIERGVRPPLLEVGNLESARDFLDVRDAVRAYWLIIQHGTANEVYNVCSGTAVLIRDVLNMLLDNAGIKVEVREDPQRRTVWDVPIQYGDPTKLRDATQWVQTVRLQDSLRDLLNLWRDRARSVVL